MKILVIGNCQARGVGRCIGMLRPEDSIEVIRYDPKNLPHIVELASKADLIFTQQTPPELSALAPGRVILYPPVIFTGFHPDTMIGNLPLGAMGPYRSALVAALYLKGISIKRAPALFNAYIFGECGYLDEFEDAKARLLQQGSEVGLELSAAFDSWLASGVFMFTINHPHIRVLLDIAKLVVKAAGLTAKEDIDKVWDGLGANGRRLAVPDFLADRMRISPLPSFEIHRSREQPVKIELADFVQQEYEAFRSNDIPKLSERPPVARALDGLLRSGIR